MRFDVGDKTLVPISRFGADEACSENCMFDDSLARFSVKGASSISHLESGGNHYVAVANYWDGSETDTASPIYEFNTVEGTLGARIQLIPTRGARAFRLISMSGLDYLVVANFIGTSTMYRWVGGSDGIDVNEPSVSIPTTGAASLETFTSGGYVYLVFACYFDKQAKTHAVPSALFRVGLAAGGSGLVALRMQNLKTVGALHARFLVTGDYRLLAISSGVAGNTSKIFVSNSSGHFNVLQELPTSRATSLSHFVSQDADYLFVSQRSDSSILFRWNGSSFLATNQPSTLPKDLAGGQVIQTREVTAAAHFFADNIDYIALGVYIADGSPGYLLESHKEDVTRLSGPSAIAVSPVHNRIYVGAYYSRAISVFQRHGPTGALIYMADVYFVPDATGDIRRGDGYPLRGITSMTVSSDGAFLYMASFFDSAVTVFGVNGATGMLQVLQVCVLMPSTPEHLVVFWCTNK